MGKRQLAQPSPRSRPERNDLGFRTEGVLNLPEMRGGRGKCQTRKSRTQNHFMGIYNTVLYIYIFLLEKIRSYSAGVVDHSLPFWITLSVQLPPSPDWHREIFFHFSPFDSTSPYTRRPPQIGREGFSPFFRHLTPPSRTPAALPGLAPRDFVPSFAI